MMFFLADFYEEIFSIMFALTMNEITELAWQGLPLLQEIFEYEDNYQYFNSKNTV